MRPDDALNVASIGFRHLAIILATVRELQKVNPSLAADVVDLGQYLADAGALDMENARSEMEDDSGKRLLLRLAKTG